MLLESHIAPTLRSRQWIDLLGVAKGIDASLHEFLIRQRIHENLPIRRSRLHLRSARHRELVDVNYRDLRLLTSPVFVTTTVPIFPVFVFPVFVLVTVLIAAAATTSASIPVSALVIASIAISVTSAPPFPGLIRWLPVAVSLAVGKLAAITASAAIHAEILACLHTRPASAAATLPFRALTHQVALQTTNVAFSALTIARHFATIRVCVETIRPLAGQSCSANTFCWVVIDVATLWVNEEAALTLAFAAKATNSAVRVLINAAATRVHV